MKAPVSVCMIVKNEEIQLENCLKSFRDYVEELVIVDTGSDDRTPEIAKKYADKFEVFTDCNSPEGLIEDFSMARQRSFDLGTQPWRLWFDGDDQVSGMENLKSLTDRLDKERKGQAISVMFPYEYARDHLGNATVNQYRERLISPSSAFKWTNPVHEVIIPIAPNTTQQIVNDIKVFHHRGNKRMESGRNLRILKKLYEKQGDADARQLYYLGLECGNAGENDNMVQMLTKYLEVSGWDDEKYMAALRLGQYYIDSKQYQKAQEIGLKAILYQENWGEAYFLIAKACYYLASNNVYPNKNWNQCIHFARRGLDCPVTQTILFVNPLERDVEIHRFLNVALCKMGDFKGALESVNLGLSKYPTDSNLIFNKQFYEKHLTRIDINNKLSNYLDNKFIEKNNYDNIMHILDNGNPAPKEEDNILLNVLFEKVKEKINIKNLFKKENSEIVIELDGEKQNNKLDIVFYVGNGLEVWTPETVKKNGIGGSELMAINIAKELAALGHKVRVYNGCGNYEGIYDGVEYCKTEKYRNLICDVLVVSRFANMLNTDYNINAKLKLLWCHDVVAINATHDLLMKADRILALTNWHKEFLLGQYEIHPDHVIVTRNGININRFKKEVKRNKYKVINSNSPDRSWPVLLECWPKIKEKEPKAELHLFYGFKNWEIVARHNPSQLDTIKRLRDKIEELKPLDVVFHDRVSQDELAVEFMSSGVWAYITAFTETSCLTAMEAQAAGTRIVTFPIAALNETVGTRGKMIPGEWTDPSSQSLFVDAVVKSMQDDNDSDRAQLKVYAENNFSLTALGKEWEDIFYNLIEEYKKFPLIPYKPTREYDR